MSEALLASNFQINRGFTRVYSDSIQIQLKTTASFQINSDLIRYMEDSIQIRLAQASFQSDSMQNLQN